MYLLMYNFEPKVIRPHMSILQDYGMNFTKSSIARNSTGQGNVTKQQADNKHA